MYGADALPLMLDQSVFSIRMRNTVRMVDDGCVVVVVLVVVVGGRVVVEDDVEVGGRGVVVVVVVDVAAAGRVGSGVPAGPPETVALSAFVAPADPVRAVTYARLVLPASA